MTKLSRMTPEMRAFAKTLLMLLAFLLVAAAAALEAEAQSTTVVVLRHGEKLDDGGDPLLPHAAPQHVRIRH